MSRTYFKTVVREVRRSLGRFLAIFAIVALGVGFLAGLLAATPDMRASVDRYYDESQTADAFIKASMGLTAQDLTVVSGLDSVEQVMPAKVTDALVQTSDSELLVTRIYGLPLERLSGGGDAFINWLSLLSGRLPQEKNECLVERSDSFLSEIDLGATLTISRDDNENIDGVYNTTEYTVVGIVSNPFYFSREREPSSIGNGRLGAVIYVDTSCYELDIYTDFYLMVKGAKARTAFTEDYEDSVAEVVTRLEQVSDERSQIRYSQLHQEGREKLDQAQAELADAEQEAEQELAKAWQEILDGRQELADAQRQLDDGYAELADARATLVQKTVDAEAEIAEAELDLTQALVELEDGERSLAQALVELEDGQREYDEGWAEFQDGEQELEEAQAKFNAGERSYRNGVARLNAAKRELDLGAEELSAARAQLEASQTDYETGRLQLSAQEAQFELLMMPILGALNSGGLPYTTSAELFQAMERDQTGAVAAAVDGVLAGMRAAAPDPETAASIPVDAAELQANWLAMQAAEVQLAAAAVGIADGWDDYHAGQADLQAGRLRYEAGLADLNDGKDELDRNRRKLRDAWAELERGRGELESARQELEDGWVETADARQELDEGWRDYNDGLVELAEAKETLSNEIAKANQELAEAEADLAQGEIEYVEGQQELAEGEADYWQAETEVEQELADAARELADGERELADLAMPEWYVLDRNANASYVSFAMNAEKVEDISTVFPAFFFLVAALVALTTMTRMVEEERTQIGTMKALGYTKGAIMAKYLVYCGAASLTGSIFGLLGGFQLLPLIIWNAFGAIYHLPPLLTQFSWPFALTATLLAIACTMLATISAGNRVMREKPATMMRPRAPQAGKRILLEQMGLIWSRMTFSHKATARNLFRYKKHFYMTVVGIAGCTALILTGFGLRDSLGSVANTQFTEIIQYDLLVQLNDDQPMDDVLIDWLNDGEQVLDVTTVFNQIGVALHDGQRVSATICTPLELAEFPGFVNLRQRTGGEEIDLNQSSVIMTEKLAQVLKLRWGDRFTLENARGELAELTLSGVAENYVGSYVYLSPEAYSSAFVAEPSGNTLMAHTVVQEAAGQDAVLTELLASDAVSTAEFVSQTKQSFDNLLSSINLVVVVLILAAGALAGIVLYNLININIDERRKELATLKVLGFHNEEVAGYIFRETLILSLIGTLAGLLLGVLLHKFVVRIAESTDLMLGRSISWPGFVLSAAITMAFSALVNAVMYRKLRQIAMVDSMKAID